MGHLLEIIAQLLDFLPPYRTSADRKSEMGKIGNFFGALGYAFLAAVVLVVLIGALVLQE